MPDNREDEFYSLNMETRQGVALLGEINPYLNEHSWGIHKYLGALIRYLFLLIYFASLLS